MSWMTVEGLFQEETLTRISAENDGWADCLIQEPAAVHMHDTSWQHQASWGMRPPPERPFNKRTIVLSGNTKQESTAQIQYSWASSGLLTTLPFLPPLDIQTSALLALFQRKCCLRLKS